MLERLTAGTRNSSVTDHVHAPLWPNCPEMAELRADHAAADAIARVAGWLTAVVLLGVNDDRLASERVGITRPSGSRRGW